MESCDHVKHWVFKVIQVPFSYSLSSLSWLKRRHHIFWFRQHHWSVSLSDDNLNYLNKIKIKQKGKDRPTSKRNSVWSNKASRTSRGQTTWPIQSTTTKFGVPNLLSWTFVRSNRKETKKRSRAFVSERLDSWFTFIKRLSLSLSNPDLCVQQSFTKGIGRRPT